MARAMARASSMRWISSTGGGCILVGTDKGVYGQIWAIHPDKSGLATDVVNVQIDLLTTTLALLEELAAAVRERQLAAS